MSMKAATCLTNCLSKLAQFAATQTKCSQQCKVWLWPCYQPFFAVKTHSSSARHRPGMGNLAAAFLEQAITADAFIAQNAFTRTYSAHHHHTSS
jgi:nicotinic acid mononucleotide adenylyltransferase